MTNFRLHSRAASAAHYSIWVGVQPAAEAYAVNAATLVRVRRKLPFLTVWLLGSVALGAAYAKTVRPDFIAVTQVVLQPRLIVNDGPEDVRHFQQVVIDSEQCETELRILRSAPLLYRVFDTFDVANSPEIRNGSDGLWAYLGTKIDQFGRTVASASQDASQQAFSAFIGRVRARRLGFSYVIEISYRAQSAAQAARVVNSIASAYAAYRLRGVLAAEQRRGVYRTSRLAKLQTQLLAAEFGMRHGSIPTQNLIDADMRLLGPANLPINIVYPKMFPVILLSACLGAISGLLIILVPHSTGSTRRRGLVKTTVVPQSARVT